MILRERDLIQREECVSSKRSSDYMALHSCGRERYKGTRYKSGYVVRSITFIISPGRFSLTRGELIFTSTPLLPNGARSRASESNETFSALLVELISTKPQPSMSETVMIYSTLASGILCHQHTISDPSSAT